jgi:trk system potassium uptake protein TrkA
MAPMKVVIVGGGKVGTSLCLRLLAEGHQVKIIEVRPDRIPRLQQDLPPEIIFLGSGTDPYLLERCGIRQTNVIVAVTGDDEVNLVVADLARHEFGVMRTIARINNSNNAWMFTQALGVDVAINHTEIVVSMISVQMSQG